ncbi:MAG TPA: hypothetical protein VIY48_12235 [Candidatus Paceibacterota bacterium]
MSDEHIKSITGRDGYIVAQALYQACKYQQRLKDEKSPLYEWSNHQDMKAILNEAYGPMSGVFVAQDKYVGREPADLRDEKREPEKAKAVS